MGTCLVFVDRSPVRERLTGHLASVFDELRCVDTVPELIEGIGAMAPDLVLVGADGGSAWLDALRGARQSHPQVPVVVVGQGDDESGAAPPTAGQELATRALGLGACGFLRAAELREELLLTARRGRSRGLSAREMDVLLGMTEGRSNAEIAAELVLAEDTVKTHARRLFRKLGAGDRADAVARGFRQGLLH